MISKNVGGADKAIRLIVGLIVIGLGVFFESWWGLLGVVIFLTGVFSRCGIYTLFGISTCPVDTSATPAAPNSPDSTPPSVS